MKEMTSRFVFPQAKIQKLIVVLALMMCAFQLYVTIFGGYAPLKLRSTHVGFVLVLIFLTTPATKAMKKQKLLSYYDVLLAICSATIVGYIYYDFDRLLNRVDLISKLTTLDFILFGLSVILVLEATRRCVGWALPIIAMCFAGYAFIGPYLSGAFWHRGMSIENFIDQSAMNLNGIYGTPIAVASTYVFLFVLFGSFLLQTGCGDTLIEIANAMAGKSKGGPAKIAVLSSMFFGTINGSSVANVITTGSVTIPMMKSMGYKKNFAGAVEAVASTGGQIMPPIMGAAAFVMAELMGESYINICIAAILPAVLYYLALLLSVHLEADKLALPTMEENDMKQAGKIFIQAIPLLIPVALLLITLCMGYSSTRAGLVALGSLVVIGIIKPKDRLTPARIIEGIVNGVKSALVVSITCATAGIITGVVNALGVGVKFTSLINTFANGNMALSLVLIMCATLILGTGLPTTAAYIIAAAVAVPPLIALGVTKMAAHFFALYFACVSSITPPVAVAAYAAAALSGGSPMKTGFTASRLGISGFIVPYLFVFNPVLLMDGTISEILLAVPTAVLGISAISCALAGWIFSKQSILFRIILFAGGLCMMIPGGLTDVIGLALCVPLVLLSKRAANQMFREAKVITADELNRLAEIQAKEINSDIITNLDMEAN